MVADNKPKIIVIAGPTASGKTGLAVALALSLGGEILNADSMQVYRYMDVGTAKPTLEERRGVIHHLLDVVDPDEEFNAAMYRRMALPLAKGICAKNIPCFIVGGTGLYIRSLLGGLVELPPSDPILRERLQLECDQKGAPKLHQRLAELDPERAESIHPNDRLRIIRALEIIQQTGRQVSHLMKQHRFGNQEFLALKLCLQVEKEPLYDRINDRSEKMLACGLVAETEHLIKKGYDPHLKSMTAIGYRHVLKYLQGEWSLQKATETLKRDTRRYAKRQMTWFKAEPDMIHIDPEDKTLAINRIRDFLAESQC
ncbi:MAG: tRNA (adenosine(37)-N6)-dimethylallyltransferase MiaA [Deltaproteobacteria bacterium]|nr:tRNA (adenosine(37)-N6)-dimethylallyltransferase MiaA [Deltaproteobacteria bacterium]